MWTEWIEILLKVLWTSHMSSTCGPAEPRRAVRMASARGRAAAAHGQTGSSWAGLIRGGCFLSATSQYPLPNPHHRKKKSLRAGQESEKWPKRSSWVLRLLSNDLWFQLRTKQTQKTANSTFKADSIEIIYNPNVVFEAECAFFSKRANITRLNNLFCLGWWFMSVLGVKYFPPQLRRL